MLPGDSSRPVDSIVRLISVKFKERLYMSSRNTSGRMRLQTIKLLTLTSIVILIFIVQHNANSDAPVNARKLSTAGQDSSRTDAIDALDRAVQKRFHNVIGFGMARIATEKKFVPETEEEKAALNSLKKVKLRVGLYLAGRMVLEPKPDESQWGQYGIGRAISPPIFVDSQTKLKELPRRLDLWEQTRKALAAFAQGKDWYEFTVGEWSVRARPVRASDQSCLRCHSHDYRMVFPANGAFGYEIKGKKNNLQIGDPIGVLLYAYSQ